MISKNKLENNLRSVQERIKAAAILVDRNPEEIKLVVVTKNRSIEEIIALYELGVRDFGENRIEQALKKTEDLKDIDDIRWHMIGHIQSRKAKVVCQIFDYLHSLDSTKLAARLDRFAKEENRIMPAMLQFNVSGEVSKSGWSIVDESGWKVLHSEIDNILLLKNIKIQGLMTMAPFDLDPENSRPYFRRLSRFRDHLQAIFPDGGFAELSMGMSGDFEVAVEEGATLVRIGSAIFND
jgi:pyridoxal phosphate enzyme (YggS family)